MTELDKEMQLLSKSLSKLAKEIDTSVLKKVHVTKHCRYSEIEQRISILQENQESIFQLLKLIYNKVK